MQITRIKLIEAIEAGIANAPGLTTAEQIALRSIGAVTDKVAVRRFKIGDCGCPLTQIGLNRDDHWDNEKEDRLNGFYTEFDFQMIKALCGIYTSDFPGTTVEIL